MGLPREDSDRLKLTGMEYLKEYNGCLFEDLPKQMQRRISETQITAYVIRQGTPNNVRNSIFKKINTGGLMLTPAEIRNAVYRGQASSLLHELAENEFFIKSTRGGIKPDRMLDCEFVNRFLAFYILGIENYKGNLEEYLNKVLEIIQKLHDDDIRPFHQAFCTSMEMAYNLFGENSFRRIDQNGKYTRINKPLFECVSLCLAKCTEIERKILIERRGEFLIKYQALFNNREFLDIISNATAKPENVKKRIDFLRTIINEVISI